MNYRPVGNTGLRFSEIGFGAGTNAGLMSTETSLADQCRVLDRAFELGINYIDTAPLYGGSEASLGAALKELGIHPIICTKVEIGPEHASDIAGKMVESVEQSLKRLRIDWVDIIMIHNSPAYQRSPNVTTIGPTKPIPIEEYLGANGAVEGFRRLRQAGKMRFGGTTMTTGYRIPIPLVKALIASGEFALLNVGYNLLNPTAGMPKPPGLTVDVDYEDIMTWAVEHSDTRFCIIRPLERGSLTDQATAGSSGHGAASTLGNKDAFAGLVERASAFRFLARDGRTLAQAAVQFILGHPGVVTVLGGFSDAEQVEDNVGALSAPPLTETELAQIELVWRSNMGQPHHEE